jgi:transposase
MCLDLQKRLAWCDERIAAHVKDSPQVGKAQQLIGIGPVTASAVVATVVDFKPFKNGAQFGAWLGLTPKQNSSGGITKRRCLPAHLTHSSGQISGDDGAQTR